MTKASKILLLVGAAALAACSDSSTVPMAPSAGVSVQGGGANAALTSSDTLRFSFTIDPSRTVTYALGQGNSIVFPAGSLCDLSSTYGAGHWDEPCAISSTTVTVNVKAWLDSHGQARLDFDKHIRFAPSSDPSKWVMLTITDNQSAARAASSILYCADQTSASCVDETKTDPSLITTKDLNAGTLKRRIKHFSGYNVFSGQPCDPSPSDPDCVDSGNSLNSRSTTTSMHIGLAPTAQLTPVKLVASRAGYMLAWA